MMRFGLVVWICASISAFAQTTEDYQELYGTPKASDQKIMRQLNQKVKAQEAEQALVTCTLKGKTPEVTDTGNCRCPRELELFTLTLSRRSVHLCCPAGSKPAIFAAQTRMAKIVCSLQNVDAGVPLPAADAGAASSTQ